MIRIIRAFLFDGVSWLLLVMLLVFTFVCVTHLFNRYDELDIYARNLAELEGDIVWLQQQQDEKKDWNYLCKTFKECHTKRGLSLSYYN